MREVEVEFAVRDGSYIAYEVFGTGPLDLLVSAGNTFPIDLIWDLPQLAAFMDALGELARVIVLDLRGHGASDPLPTTEGVAGVESGAADMLAVLDAVGCERASMLIFRGSSELVIAATAYWQPSTAQPEPCAAPSRSATSYPGMAWRCAPGYTLARSSAVATM